MKVLSVFVGLFLSVLVVSAGSMQAQVKSKTDHPLVSRYQGATIEYSEIKQFDEFSLPLSAAKDGKLTKTKNLQGKVTRLTYFLPEDRTSIEIQKNYEQSLRKAGFAVLFSCGKEQCGDGWLRAFLKANPTTDGHDMLPGAALGNGHPDKQRYIAAHLARPQGDAYVSVFISQGWYRHAMVQLDVIEVKAMETDKVTVDAAAMKASVLKVGHVSLYGLLFDTNKAEVKPESAETLVEIAKLLKQNSGLRLYVVGHTDNVGAIDANIKLSERRANAVIKALVNAHGAATGRLRGFGVGPLAPVAANDSDAGRAKNRRVELVVQ